MTIILAIESSTETASVALYISGAPRHGADRLLHRQVTGVQMHSHTVLPMLQSLLAEAGLGLGDCDAVAFGAGPGSFTGVRTACGISQGLAYGADLPVIAVDTLQAAAQACRDATGASDVMVVLDARMGQVYWGQYKWIEECPVAAVPDGMLPARAVASSGAWQVVSAPRLDVPAAVAMAGNATACGSGLAVHAAAFASCGFAAGARSDVMPHAVQVAKLAQALLVAGKAVAARDARPVYLRNDVALTTVERAEKRAEAA